MGKSRDRLLYIGTANGLYRAEPNGGDAWTDCDQLRSLPSTKDWTFPRPPHVSHIKDFGFSLTDPLRILCPIEEGWLLRTTDGGNTWENLQDEVEFDAHYVTVMP